MNEPYKGRAQTRAKHFILKNYLERLTYKLLESGNDSLAYIDGFSGPWKSETEDFSDTSFMIALNILYSAHKIYRAKGRNIVTKCFFAEENNKTFKKLEEAVKKYNNPSDGFFVKTFNGKFENAVSEIQAFTGNSFTLVFIDPTGWTGYPYDKISPILKRNRGEVLINFMYDHINRFAAVGDPKIETSLAPILGGLDWKARLDKSLSVGRAVEKLFRQTLKSAGDFKYVLSTCIEKSTVDRPHFFIAYGTRSPKGLEVFREVEHKALKGHHLNRLDEKIKKEEARTGQFSMLTAIDLATNLDTEPATENRNLAKNAILAELAKSPSGLRFVELWPPILEQHMVRVTDIKDICVELADEGCIHASWKHGTSKRRKKPDNADLIVRVDNSALQMS